MAKARPARKVPASRIDAAGRSHTTATTPPLQEEPTMEGGQNEDLQTLKSTVQLLAEQQAVQAQCMNLLLKRIHDDIQPDAAEQEKDVEFPPPRDPLTSQPRSGQPTNDLEPSNGTRKASNTMLADLLEDVTVINYPQSKANRSGKARVDIKDPKSLQNGIAWKWRWAVEANKTKELSQKINELESGRGRVNKDVTKNNNQIDNYGKKKDDHVLAKALRRPSKLNLKGPRVPLPSPTSTGSPSLKVFEDGDFGYKASSKVESLQKQVSQLTTCFNKMMPTLIFLVNRAGSQKLVNHCFYQWKAISSMNNHKNHHQKHEVTQNINPCSRVLKGLGLKTINDPTLQNSRSPRVQRKLSMADIIPPKFAPTPHTFTTATSKALHTLQVSLHQELEELQGILASEVESLKRQVEGKRPSHNLKRYGEGSRWKHDLISVWEVCNNVAQLLNKARYKLPSNCELPLVTHPICHLPAFRNPNRHRNAACQPLITIAASKSPRGIRPALPTPIISITTPEPSRGMRPPIDACDGTIVHVSRAGANACHVHITPKKGGSRTAKHLQAEEEWHGRQCVSAKHAASLQRQIERLKARHKSACARLQYHQELYPGLPHKTTVALLQQPPSRDSHKSSSKETQT